MSEQPEKPQAQQPPAEWEGSGEQVYANAMKLSAGAYDVMITFGRQKHADQLGEVPPVTEVVGVTMSWAHVKSMIPLLARVVAQYESQFGQIPAPGFGESWKV